MGIHFNLSEIFKKIKYHLCRVANTTCLPWATDGFTASVFVLKMPGSVWCHIRVLWPTHEYANIYISTEQVRSQAVWKYEQVFYEVLQQVFIVQISLTVAILFVIIKTTR